MDMSVSIDINAKADKVWSVLSDIDNSAKNIRGIEKVEILKRPEGEGLVGLKWRETRLMYGKEATEVMWITDATENKSYRTRAESHGAIYISGFDLAPVGEGTKLTMVFKGEAITFMAKVMNVIFSGMMKKSMVKTVQEDLEDIKKAVEALA